MILSACRTIIFDLEFYVPPNSRKEVGFSYNPWDKKSKLIGGFVLSVNPTVNFKLSDQVNSKKAKSFWLWDCPSEKELLLDIYDFLLKQSNIVQKAHKQRHSTN